MMEKYCRGSVMVQTTVRKKSVKKKKTQQKKNSMPSKENLLVWEKCFDVVNEFFSRHKHSLTGKAIERLGHADIGKPRRCPCQ